MKATVRATALGAVALAAFVAAGCELVSEPACPGRGAACCAAWSRLEGDACVARRWSTPRELAPAGLGPRVVAGDDGTLGVVWLSADGPLSVSIVPPGEEGQPAVRRPYGSVQAIEAELAVRDARSAAVIWRERTDETEVRHGELVGSTWWWSEAPLNVGATAAEPTIVADRDAYLLVWNQWTGENWGIATATAAEGRLTRRPAHVFDVLSPLWNFSNTPRARRGADGAAVITWFQATTDMLATFVSERQPGSVFFSHPGLDDFVSPRGADVDNPRLDMLPNGDVALAWRQEHPVGRYALQLATREGGLWSAPRALEEALTPAVELVHNVQIAFAKTGDLFIVWQQDDGGDKAVFVAHRRADGHWVAPGSAPFRLSAEGVRAYDPALAAGEHGVLASWTERPEGGDAPSRVVARRGSVAPESADESVAWGSPTVLSETDAAGASQVAIGGPGDRAACVWIEGGRVMFAVIE